MEKNANLGLIAKKVGDWILKHPNVSAGAGTVAFDQMFHGADLIGEKNDTPVGTRALSALINFLLLAGGIKGKASLGEWSGITGGMLAKDFIISANKATNTATKSIEELGLGAKGISDSIKTLAEYVKNSAKGGAINIKNSGVPTWLLGSLGIGALGLGGAALWKYLKSGDGAEVTKAEVTVPGAENDPYSSIKVQIPVNSDYFGNKLISGVTRGVKDLVRTNVKANSKKIDPNTGKKIPYEEWVMKYGDDDEKEELGFLNTEQVDSIKTPVKSASQMMPPPPHGLPLNEKCRRPVPPAAPTMASSNMAPGGNDRAGYCSSKIMAILARKNARQSGAVLGEKPATPIMQPKQAGFYIDAIDCNRLTKSASVIDLTARQEVSDIMNRIYNEDPSAWPYGLNIPGHDSVYLIRDKMTKQAAGFVGWQETTKNGKKIGSYSIGILPEYRHNGFAKEAVSKVLQIKSAGVDEVKAFIVDGNKPSERLASSLGVAIEKKF